MENNINKKLSAGVACVMIKYMHNKGAFIYLTKRKGKYEHGKYACPGGMFENVDITPENAIKREIREETGLIISKNRLKRVHLSLHMNQKSDITIWYAYTMNDSDRLINREPTKHGEWEPYTPWDAKKLPLMLSTPDVLDVIWPHMEIY
jgi:ADP-ribose pyrophosphatase YjhB (NUDIX family)